MTAKRSNGLYKVAAIFFFIGVGYLLFSSIAESSIPYVHVAEALTLPSEKIQPARISGTVKEGGVTMLEGNAGVVFLLADIENPAHTLTVSYKGPVPDTFKDGIEVFVEGQFPQNSKQFDAKTLMTKCPSKYQKENRG